MNGRTAIDGFSGRIRYGLLRCRCRLIGLPASGALHFARRANEPEAFARKRADQTLLLAAVTDRGSRCADARAQSRFRNNATIPDGVDQVILAKDALTVSDQIGQEIKDLRLKDDRRIAKTQFASLRVENIVIEAVKQLTNPQEG